MSNLLKSVFDRKTIENLADRIALEYSEFNRARFMGLVYDERWEDRSLMERVRHLSTAIHQSLDLPFSQTVDILQKVSVNFSGLFHFIFADYVGQYGLSDYDTSIEALGFFTCGSTSEFAIREFLKGEPQRTLRVMQEWAKSDNEHLRRLSSEGIRPRLPWASRLLWVEDNPDCVLPIIESLKTDSSAYVRKSVANLLNDFTKTQPQWVLDLFDRWISQSLIEEMPASTSWIIKHALRTLLKQANPQALALVGYSSPDFGLIEHWETDRSARIGERFCFNFSLSSAAGSLGRLRLEYALTFLRKGPKPYRKVFKIAEGEYLDKNRHFQKQHDFKPITTRRYYAGTHFIELIVNGKVLAASEFELLEAL